MTQEDKAKQNNMTIDFGLGPVTISDEKLYTPDPKQAWLPNEVMVFGSNKQGHHYGGAAHFAHKALGAEWGVGEGRTGQTYAFPTLNFATTDLQNDPGQFEGLSHRVTQTEFDASFVRLKEAILAEPDKIFYITKLGLGIAGWELFDVHKSFWDSGIAFECPNAIYPAEFEMPDDAL